MNILENTYVGILAGGKGTRFWPASTEANPKQFLDILGTGKTLIQQTYERVQKFLPHEKNILIISGSQYKSLLKEQLPDVSEEQLILEPVGRNTAPSIAYAAFKIHKQNPEGILIVLPSDHFITPDKDFYHTLNITLQGVQENPDAIFTIGITPTYPATGYGYIQFVNPEEEISTDKYYPVKTFTEKPSLEVAKQFLASGDFLWNAGMFIFKVSAVLEKFKKFMPDLYELFSEIYDKLNTPQEAEAISHLYAKCLSNSFDFGIMEHVKEVFVVPSKFTWNDVGTWKALYDISPKDREGNVIMLENALVNTTNSLLVSSVKDKVYAIKGLDNFIFVDTDKATLILPLDDEQGVKEIVKKVQTLYKGKYS